MCFYRPTKMISATAVVLLILCAAGVRSQEDPWPPLVTTCDVMPLVAADADRFGGDLVACSSTSWPTCEIINCQVLANNDQLELELLPCWQHPAMWIKNRALGGKILYQDIFASSRTATANIGGDSVTLNVTIVQRGITLGFGVNVTVPGSSERTIIPYRDIPLNLTECGGGSPDYPITCKMILYMEQYIITSRSNRSRNPTLVPQCLRPDSKSCDWMTCTWDINGVMMNHTYQFLRCADPQAFRLIMTQGKQTTFNETFNKSKVIQQSGKTGVNVTIKYRMPDQTFGFQVDLLTSNGTITEIPYTVLPLGCPPSLSQPPTSLTDLQSSDSVTQQSTGQQHSTVEPSMIVCNTLSRFAVVATVVMAVLLFTYCLHTQRESSRKTYTLYSTQQTWKDDKAIV